METETKNKKDDQLWRTAKQRASFKWSLMMYLLVNSFLIGVWYFTESDNFWPIWPILGWGLGIIIQYFKAYQTFNLFSADREYEKLKEKETGL